MRRRQLNAQRNSGAVVPLPGDGPLAVPEAVSPQSPGLPSYKEVNRKKGGWPKGRARKPGVSRPYEKGRSV